MLPGEPGNPAVAFVPPEVTLHALAGGRRGLAFAARAGSAANPIFGHLCWEKNWARACMSAEILDHRGHDLTLAQARFEVLQLDVQV